MGDNQESEIYAALKNLRPRGVDRVWRFLRKIKRSWEYAKLGWSNYDFDFVYLFELLRFKLERMEKFLTGPNAVADHATTTLRSLKLAVRLAKKLETDSYDFFSNKSRKRWKHVKMFEDIEPTAAERQAGIGLVSKPCTTQEAMDAHKDFIRAAEADVNIRKRDLRWFFSILEKYHEHWWD